MSTNTDPQSKVVLVTGGMGDIGKATALKFAANGWQVALNDLISAHDALPQIATWNAPIFHYWSADNANRAAVDEMMAEVEAQLGLPTVAIVNAGGVQPMPFLEMTPENWRYHLDVNLTGAFHVAQALARRLVATGTPGRILFTGSWVQEVPRAAIPAYCVSKSGLKMLAKVMALDLARCSIR